MTRNDTQPVAGAIFDDATEITIVELCDVCALDRTEVDAMIDEGILEPMERGRSPRRLPYSSVRRTRTAIHLQRDLGVNLAGAALALELLERIDSLRMRLRKAEQ